MVLAAARPGLRRNAVTVAAPFTPTSLTGLALWLDAGQITGATDGAAVGTWQDRSGNARDATQATASKQPIYRSSGAAIITPSGKPVVQFDGVDDYMDSPLALAMPMTVFVAFAQNDVVAVVFDNANGNGGALGAYHNSAGAAWIMETGGASVTSTQASDTAWHTATFVHEAPGVSMALYFDGVLKTSAVNAGTVSMGGLRLAVNRLFDPNSYMSGVYSEIIVYNRTVTATERQQVEGYLRSRHGTP